MAVCVLDDQRRELQKLLVNQKMLITNWIVGDKMPQLGGLRDLFQGSLTHPK